mgnify:CR=1 FL=1
MEFAQWYRDHKLLCMTIQLFWRFFNIFPHRRAQVLSWCENITKCVHINSDYIVAMHHVITQRPSTLEWLISICWQNMRTSLAVGLVNVFNGLIGTHNFWYDAQSMYLYRLKFFSTNQLFLYIFFLYFMKVIKLYAWEAVFEQKIAELRQKEVTKQRTINILSAIQETITYILPVLVW